MKNSDPHVDQFIDDPKSDPYASWVFALFRFPAILKMKFQPFLEAYKLFCSYKGNRYRVTGCSRMGDVWLHSDFEEDTTYEHRVLVDDCSDWGAFP